MRLCICTPQLPCPPEQGATLRNFHLLRHAARRHDVTLASIAEPHELVPHELRELCADIVIGTAVRRMPVRRAAEIVLPQPDLARRVSSPALARALAQLQARLGPWDVVQIEGLEMAPLALGVSAQRRVLDEHNAEYVLQWSSAQSDASRGRWLPALYSLAQTVKLRRYEASVCRSVQAVAAVSTIDRRALKQIAPTAPVTVVPNGVDTAYYTPQPHEERPEPPVLLFTGKMDFRPNVDGVLWFAREVLPRIWTSQPETRFIVFGMRPTPAIRALAADPRIDVTGHVPGAAAERGYLGKATVFVAPLLAGGGTRLKLLTAMASARAIVSTPTGCSGLTVRDGAELLVAATPRHFANSVLTLLDSCDMRRRLGAAARLVACQRYDWAMIGRQMEEIYG